MNPADVPAGMLPATPENLAACGVDLTHVFGGGAYIKAATLKAGTTLAQHVHERDHRSVLVAGTVEVCVDGIALRYSGWNVLTIHAGRQHSITAITDALWLCVWETGETDPARVDAAILEG